ncbi:unnamed protein product [Trypanosoma congolense IL3000]|uniref:WGS project CAEQ00000000 data, annotated contig 806 n=1 Tax=Trypanosoma congolense (strain IL3000) TaxID=1068625 RepID=F9WIK4_TRYCI|nr:unnamed protein product [Trypanosoma congolense IL3000]
MMKFFFIVIVVFVSVMGNDHYNKKEFEHLCKILKVAEGEPQKIPDELRNITETRHILQRLLRATKTSSSTYQKVVQLKSDDKEDTEFISYTVKRRIANEKIQHAMEKVKDIYSRMEEELIQATNERTLARNNLVHAIYGVQVGELPQDKEITDVLKNISRSSISNDNGGEKKVKYHEAKMEKPCGGAGESGAGFTLINDFYCLCVGKENAKAVCHEKIRGPCCCCCGVKCQDCKCEKNCDDCKCKNCDGCEDCKLHNKWLSLFDVIKAKL